MMYFSVIMMVFILCNVWIVHGEHEHEVLENSPFVLKGMVKPMQPLEMTKFKLSNDEVYVPMTPMSSMNESPDEYTSQLQMKYKKQLEATSIPQGCSEALAINDGEILGIPATPLKLYHIFLAASSAPTEWRDGTAPSVFRKFAEGR